MVPLCLVFPWFPWVFPWDRRGACPSHPRPGRAATSRDPEGKSLTYLEQAEKTKMCCNIQERFTEIRFILDCFLGYNLFLKINNLGSFVHYKPGFCDDSLTKIQLNSLLYVCLFHNKLFHVYIHITKWFPGKVIQNVTSDYWPAWRRTCPMRYNQIPRVHSNTWSSKCRTTYCGRFGRDSAYPVLK